MSDQEIRPVKQTLYGSRDSLSAYLKEVSAQLPLYTHNNIKAVLMTYHNTLLNQLEKRQQTRTVEEAAEAWYPGQTFDAALPQPWVDSMAERGFEVRGHFITLYPDNAWPYMAPITQEGVEIAARAASTQH